ncbi:hypothetical protein N8911_02075 [bacterium]|nr:hypothetical protein [bacterium]MDC1221735.1 hypothetical protein [Salibacteraceae bacterium]
MRAVLTLALLLAIQPLVGQESSKFGEKLGMDILIYDASAYQHRILSDTLSKEDSISCVLRSTFKTDSTDVFFLQEHDLEGHLKEEGYAQAIWIKRNLLGIRLNPKQYTIEKHGSWTFYNKGGQIISNCAYKNDRLKSGCKWFEFDDSGKMINVSYLDF